MFTFSFNSVMSSSYQLHFYDTYFLPLFTPREPYLGSFYSVRLMLSICHSKFAPILWQENTLLFPFVFEFICSPFSVAVLDNIHFASFASHQSCVFPRLNFLETSVAWSSSFGSARFLSILRLPPDFLWQCMCPRFHTSLYQIRVAAAYRKTIKREILTGKALFAVNVQLDLRRVMIS